MISQFSGHKSGQLQLTAFIVPRKVLSTLTDGAIVKANCVTICTVNLVDLASGVAEPANAVEARQNQLRFFVRITPVYSTSRVILRGYQGHPSSNSGGGGVGVLSYIFDMQIHDPTCTYAGAYALYESNSGLLTYNGRSYDVWEVNLNPAVQLTQSDLQTFNSAFCTHGVAGQRLWTDSIWSVDITNPTNLNRYTFPSSAPAQLIWIQKPPNGSEVYAMISTSDLNSHSITGRRWHVYRVDGSTAVRVTTGQVNTLHSNLYPHGGHQWRWWQAPFKIPSTAPEYSQYYNKIPANLISTTNPNFNAETIGTSTNPYVPLRFQYIQAIIRVTGHASDVRVRIEERIPLRPTFAVPENAIHTAGTLCKLLTADNAGVGTNYEPSLLPTGLPSKWLSYLDQECNVYQ